MGYIFLQALSVVEGGLNRILQELYSLKHSSNFSLP